MNISRIRGYASISILIIALIISGLIFFNPFDFDGSEVSLTETSAHSDSTSDGSAANVTVFTPSVSGDDVSVSGDVHSGMVGCDSGGGGNFGELCFCCDPSGVGPGVSFRTCQLGDRNSSQAGNQVTYEIRNSGGTLVKSGSATMSISNSPSGCTTSCNDTANQCQQTASYSFSATNLADGNYTVSVRADDCSGTSVDSNSFSISTAVDPVDVVINAYDYNAGSFSGGGGDNTVVISDNQDVQLKWWPQNATSCTASGDWDGPKSTSFGASQNLGTRPVGTYNFIISCSNSAGTDSDNIIVEVLSSDDPEGEQPTLTCSVNKTSASTGESITFTGNISGGEPSYHYWFSGDSDTGTGNCPRFGDNVMRSSTGNVSCTETYSTERNFIMSFKVKDNNGNDTTVSADCPRVTVTEPVVTDPGEGTINVYSNLATTWSLSGPESRTQSTNVTSQTYTNMDTGTYTLSPASKSGYTVSVSPSSSQTLSDGSTIDFYITYTSSSGPYTVDCTPDSQTVEVGATVGVRNIVDGSPPSGRQYGFSAPGGTPSSSSQWSSYFETVYSTVGVKKITASYPSGSTTYKDDCIVNVVDSSTIQVRSSVDGTETTGAGILRVQGPADIGGTTSYNRTYTTSIDNARLRAPSGFGGGTFENWTGTAPGTLSGRDYTFSVSAGNTETIRANYTTLVNNASCVGITAPDSVEPGETFSATITMRNSGTKPWKSTDQAFHRLGSQPGGDNTWGTTRVNMPTSPINPGSNVSFTRNFTAPGATGTYNFDWRMVEEYIQWFGETCRKPIQVANVDGTINVNSNVPTTWTITGPEKIVQSAASAGESYVDKPFGVYTISPNDPDGYFLRSIIPSSSQTLGESSDPITFTLDYERYPECSDEMDNDGDTHIDYPADPGCDDRDDDNESDDPLPPDEGGPDFSLTSSNNITVNKEQSLTSNTSTIRVSPQEDFQALVQLSVLSGPGEIGAIDGYELNPDELFFADYQTGSQFRVTVPADFPAGNYPIVIQGEGGGLTRTTTVILSVDGDGPVFEEF